MSYVSHAKTAEELKAEVCSDLKRRLQFCQGQLNLSPISGAAKARISAVINELTSLHDYWYNLEIIRAKRNSKPKIDYNLSDLPFNDRS